MVSDLKFKERTVVDNTKVQRKVVPPMKYIPDLMMPEILTRACTCVCINVTTYLRLRRAP